MDILCEKTIVQSPWASQFLSRPGYKNITNIINLYNKPQPVYQTDQIIH